MTRASSKPDLKSGLVWPRPTIVPLPLTTAGVQTPVMSLDGTWKLNAHPPQEFWSNAIDPASWTDIPVPGCTTNRGFGIQEDQEYAYRTRVRVPSDWAGTRIFLRFDGVTGYARVWVGGQHVRDHYGGFTSWNCEVTDLLSPGEEAWLTVGVTDKPREISIFNLGGIIRDVRLVAVPTDHVTRLHVETDLDAEYRDATLKVTAAMAFGHGDEGTVRLILKDPQGSPVVVTPASIDLSRSHPEGTAAIPVAAPIKWDAEHPNLYRLEASVVVEGQVVETLARGVGFRKIEVVGNKLYVNGREVKLRGVNRHDISPTTGRAITPELVEQDVRLFRAANINFVRTSHYPPREDFLDICDRYGMYVEDEIAVAFVYQSIQPTQNDPDFTAAYMGQFAEMIERDRSHPCIIMWSLANESYWGRNFQAEYDYAKAEDTTRPVIFSYPITMPEGTQAYDIWSLHYAEYGVDVAAKTDNHSIGESWGHDAPVLHDEYAHIVCYNLPEQMRDPAVREFWGEGIKRFWEDIFTTEGALGGAIWASIDDIMVTDDGYKAPEGYRALQWGIVDGWRRQKPEYWLTQKGYSPIRVDERPLANPGSGNPLQVPIKNWFDHTNLSEITVRWAAGPESGVLSGPDVAPHGEGVLTLPAREWKDGERVRLEFYRMGDILVDAFSLPIGTPGKRFPGPQGPVPRIAEEEKRITVAGADWHIVFSKETGLITSSSYKGTEVLTGGPYLNLVGVVLAPWSLQRITAGREGEEAVVRIAGRCGGLAVRFELRIDGQALITTTYTLVEVPFRPPRARRLRVGLDVGGYREVGVAYLLSNGVDWLTWERKGLWSAYPDDHIGRTTGVAYRVRQRGDERYGVRPTWPWGEDMCEYALFGKYDLGGCGTQDFRSMKHNIWYASAVVGATGMRARAESDGSDAVRLEVLDKPGARVDDRDSAVRFVGTWQPMDGESKSYHATEMISNKRGDYAKFTFRGTGICWIGAKDLIYGEADVYVDGVLEAAGIDLYCGPGFGASRGEEKVYQEVLFSKEGLADMEHAIRIVVTGAKNPRSNNAYVSVDAFVVLGTPTEAEVRMNINSAWNYPELDWGNYVKKPILVGTGYTNTVRVRLTDHDG